MRGSDVLAALQRIPEVVICEILSGDFDIMVRLEAASLERARGIGRTSPRRPSYGTRSPRSPCPTSSTARAEGGALRKRSERRRCLFPGRQPALDREVHHVGPRVTRADSITDQPVPPGSATAPPGSSGTGATSRTGSEGREPEPGSTKKVMGAKGVLPLLHRAMAASAPHGLLLTACCGGPVLPMAGIRAACRREGRASRSPACADGSASHSRSGHRDPEPGAALEREGVGVLSDRPSGLPGLAGRQAGRRRWGRGPCASAKPGLRCTMTGPFTGTPPAQAAWAEAGSRVSRSVDEPGHARVEPSGRGWRYLVRSDLFG